jgi:Fe-S-cluster-containing hydrogenase component 2
LRDYEKTGVLNVKNLTLPSEEQLRKGVAITECIQRIPCNPCVDSCPVNAISMRDINAPPIVDYDKCIGCTKCVGICPGLAIFVVKKKDDKAFITIPYEFYPYPFVNQIVEALDRRGCIMDKAIVKKVLKKGKTLVVTLETNERYAMDVRNIRF